ncbi:hypothetical protein MRB53_028644 [Persea americana]|uniref:Uncharacterized protein n=1 Tax=Persea americana TaxID=3435 RepID=A0ACC2KG23_PERAE|nr:hypothetical protein MRB53_028644 [Persea americana]
MARRRNNGDGDGTAALDRGGGRSSVLGSSGFFFSSVPDDNQQLWLLRRCRTGGDGRWQRQAMAATAIWPATGPPGDGCETRRWLRQKPIWDDPPCTVAHRL